MLLCSRVTDDVITMPLLAARSRVAGLVVFCASFELVFSRLRFQIYFLHSMVAVVAVGAIAASATTAPIGCPGAILDAMLDVSFPGQSARDFVFLLFFFLLSLHCQLAFFMIHTFAPRGCRLRWSVALGEEGW